MFLGSYLASFTRLTTNDVIIMGMFYYSQEMLSLHKITNNDKILLFYKVQYIVGIAGTDKTDNLTCEIIYDNFTCENLIAFQSSSSHQS